MGRPKKQNVEVEAATPLSNNQDETNDLPNEQEKEKEIKIVLVKMVRDLTYPEPRTADVHPLEVENYKMGGWVTE